MSQQVQPAQAKESFNLGQFLAKQKSQIAAALPSHLTADRMLRIVMTEVRKTPKLKDCTPQSLIGAVIQASQLGLEPGSALGHCYLIPYGKECQFIIGYRGMIDLARRSGQIISISANVVYKGDLFKFEFGLNEDLKHIPSQEVERNDDDIICAYMIAKLKDGGHQIEIMFKKELDKIRGRSKAAWNGPWVTDYPEMCKKTVVRRGFKYLPISIELADAIMRDDSAEDGEQNNGLIFEGDFDVVETPTETKTKKSDSIASKISDKKEASPPAQVIPEINQAEIDAFVSDMDKT